MKLASAYAAGMYQTKDVNTHVKAIVCDDEDKRCMYRECSKCQNQDLKYAGEDTDVGDQLTWSMWKNRRIEKGSNTDTEKSKVISMTERD